MSEDVDLDLQLHLGIRITELNDRKDCDAW